MFKIQLNENMVMKKSYTKKEKIEYYKRRVNDISLREGQRRYAKAFLDYEVAETKSKPDLNCIICGRWMRQGICEKCEGKIKRNEKAVENIKQKATEQNHLTKEEMQEMDVFDEGGWVDTDTVCKALNIDFSTAFRQFEFSRTAEWWSLCGETDEERKRNGQKITTQFRKKTDGGQHG